MYRELRDILPDNTVSLIFVGLILDFTCSVAYRLIIGIRFSRLLPKRDKLLCCPVHSFLKIDTLSVSRQYLYPFRHIYCTWRVEHSRKIRD
jgi:hypothetical protein